MSEDAGRAAPDAERVVELLRREAAEHLPDHDRILARVDRGRREPAAARRDRRPRRVQQVGQLAVAAAAVALVLSVTGVQRWTSTGTGLLLPAVPAEQATTTDGAGPTDAVAAPTPTDASGGPAGGPAGAPAGGTGSGTGGTGGTAGPNDPGRTPEPRPTVGRPRPVPSAGGRRVATAGVSASSVAAGPAAGAVDPATAAADAPGAAPGVTIASLATGTAVTLPGSPARDWVAVGARRDGKLIRDKSGNGAILQVTGQGATPVPTAGPLLVSWSGGSPEQDHVDAPSWWAVPAGDGSWRIVVRVDSAGTVTLVAGTAGVPAAARATLTAALTGPDGAATATRRTARLPAGAALATITVPAAAAGGTLTLTLSASGSGGVLAVSAVTVR